MGHNLELKGKSEAALEVLVKKENIPDPPFSGQQVLQSGTNCKGNAYDKEASPIEQTPLSSRNEDVEVNITGCTNSSKALMEEDTIEDATECSSSFGDTGSGSENGSAFSDAEVMSQMYATNAFSSMFWCEPSLIRKKKLTTYWRRFISPLRWRCKWLELKLKQLQSQALKYDKELAAYDYRKQQEFAKFTSEGFDTKSVPLAGQIRRKKVMKRKRRKRVEETCNVASYMSDHSVFSYYENRNLADRNRLKEISGVAIGSNDNNEEFKFKSNDIWSSLDCKDSDKTLENIIQKIEAVQSQVQKLRTRIDKVVSENTGKFCSENNSNMLGPYDNSAAVAANENSFSVRNQLMEKTKESVEEQKSISLAQVSEPDFVTKNAVPIVNSTLKACSSKSNVSRGTRRPRQKSRSKRQCRK